jgi:hypothetical protein
MTALLLTGCGGDGLPTGPDDDPPTQASAPADLIAGTWLGTVTSSGTSPRVLGTFRITLNDRASSNHMKGFLTEINIPSVGEVAVPSPAEAYLFETTLPAEMSISITVGGRCPTSFSAYPVLTSRTRGEGSFSGGSSACNDGGTGGIIELVKQ